MQINKKLEHIYSLWKPITIYIELFVQYILLLPIGNKILQLYRLFQPQNQ